MQENNQWRLESIEKYNHMIEKQAGRAIRPFREDGYVNLVNKYGTQKDQSEQYRFIPEPEYPDELLAMYYEGNGLFAKIIDTPAEEAVKHGFELDGVNDEKLISFYKEALDELDWDETAMTALKWARLFGGAIAVMLINDGRGLEEPVDWRHIQSIDDIRVFDRSLIQPDYQSLYIYDNHDPFRTRGSRLGMPEYFSVFSKHGNFIVHESRCLVFQNGILPENTRSTTYQMWGVPEYIRIHRAVRDAEIAHRNAPKLLERSVQPVYKMKDLSMELATEQGEETLLRRLQAIDMARGVMNSIAIDAEGEDFDFKSFQFTGINDVISASCNMLSAVTNIPQPILFGAPIGGLSSTDDTAMENYYNYIERIQRRMVKTNLRYLLSVVFQAGVMTGEVDEVPKIKVKFNPLWSMSDLEQADLEQKKAAAQQTRAQTAQLYVDMQVIDPTEVRKKLAGTDEFDIETLLDDYDEEDLFGEQVPESLSYLGEEDQQKVLEMYGKYGGAHPPQQGEQPEGGVSISHQEGVAEEEKNKDPGTEGSASTAAPAATKLPQDMSEQEKEKTGQDNDNSDSEEPNTSSSKTASVGVICVRDGKILMAQRKKGQSVGLFGGPGGHIERGETPEQAAFRETEEEFGISPKDLTFLGYGPTEQETGYQPAIYLCTEWEGEPDPVDGEMGKGVWATMEQLHDLDEALFPPFKNGLDLLEKTLEDSKEDTGKKPLDFRSVCDTVSLRNFILQFRPEDRSDASGQRANGNWVTWNGVHILLDKEGYIAKGPDSLRGKSFAEIISRKNKKNPEENSPARVELPEKPTVYVPGEIERLGLKINKCKVKDQNKHYKDSGRYEKGKSYLTIPIDELSEIVKTNAGKGFPLPDRKGNWRQIENIDCGRVIGYTVDKDGNEEPTRFADLHYSKEGWHLVPTFDRRNG